jgi:hypothetical protein
MTINGVWFSTIDRFLSDPSPVEPRRLPGGNGDSAFLKTFQTRQESVVTPIVSRDCGESGIVLHNPLLLSYFRRCHCFKVIHAEQCIGHVLRYSSKNSDFGGMSLQNVLYELYSVTRVDKLQYYTATHVFSASECFPGILGYWRGHMKQTVHILGIHIHGQKSVLTSGLGDPLKKLTSRVPLKGILVTQPTVYMTN